MFCSQINRNTDLSVICHYIQKTNCVMCPNLQRRLSNRKTIKILNRVIPRFTDPKFAWHCADCNSVKIIITEKSNVVLINREDTVTGLDNVSHSTLYKTIKRRNRISSFSVP